MDPGAIFFILSRAVVVYADFINKMVQYFSDNKALGAWIKT